MTKKKPNQQNEVPLQEIDDELLEKFEVQYDAIVEALVKTGMSREQAEAQRKAFT